MRVKVKVISALVTIVRLITLYRKTSPLLYK